MTEDINKSNEIKTCKTGKPSHIVGIGASAGGLKALQLFFENIQPETGIAFVIIQHLSPDYKSMMAELLSKNTTMPVCRAEDGMEMEANHIYLITPRMNITTMNGKLFLSQQKERHGLNLPIDIFFRSLSEDQGERAIGIILSGTGSDGSRGLRAIKSEGGTVFVQDEVSAEFDGMPRCAIATGLADFILPPEQMPGKLLRFINHPRIMLPEEPLETIKKQEDSFTKLFSILKKKTQVDFAYYKPATVIRRIERRIGLVQVNDIDQYLEYIHKTPQEINRLFKDLLIGVTKFFRDRDAFQSLAEKVVPQIIAAAVKRNPPQLRIWNIGCSTGEEAYSLAMLIQDYIDENDVDVDVKIFSTDIDQQAIEFAGPGTYPESIAADVPVKFLSKYFDKIQEGYRVKKRIRQMVIFAMHNIINDPPFTKLDLVVCRNLLIYLQTVLQKKVFNTINYILQKDGFLFLGNSETLIAVEDAFDDVDSKNRLYQHRQTGDIPISAPFSRAVTPEYTYSAARASYENNPDLGGTNRFARQERYYQGLIGKVVDTLLVVNETRELIQSFGDTERFLKIPKGNTSLDILVMLPKQLAVAVSTAIQRVRKDKKPVHQKNIKLRTGGRGICVNFHVELFPQADPRNGQLFIINIVERKMENEMDAQAIVDVKDYLAEERIEDLEREIQFTRENLQATIEELQATNEELLASNEELQSTNEELQSVNEELNTVNAEYQNKVLELTELNMDMDNLLTSSDIPTIFLDKKLRIRKFTRAMTGEVNLMEQDVGRAVTDLSLPMFTSLKRDALRVIKDGKPLVRTVRHKDEWFLQRILPFVSDKNQVEGVVLTLVRITDQKNAERAWEMQHNVLLSILQTSPAAIVMVDARGRINFVNDHAEKVLGIDHSRLLRMKINSKKFGITDLNNKPIPAQDQPLAQVLASEKKLEKYILCIRHSDGTKVVLNLNANPTFNPKKQVNGAVFQIEPVAYDRNPVDNKKETQ